MERNHKSELLEFDWLLWDPVSGLSRLGMHLTRRLYTLVNATGWLARVVEVVVPPGYNRTFHHYDLEYWMRGECSRGLFTLFVLDE